MIKDTLNITPKSKAGNNCLNVLYNLTLSPVEIMPILGETMITCFFSVVRLIRSVINTLLRNALSHLPRNLSR